MSKSKATQQSREEMQTKILKALKAELEDNTTLSSYDRRCLSIYFYTQKGVGTYLLQNITPVN